MKIHEALNEVMKAVPAVPKNERNEAPGQGNYSYRGIDAIVNAVGPALRAHGVIVLPEVLQVDHEFAPVGQKQTMMELVRLTVRFTFVGPEGDTLSATVVGSAFDSGDKAGAKAHSVAFRTALLQVLALPTDETDPDAETYERVAVDVDELVQKIGNVEYDELGKLWRDVGHLKLLGDERVKAAFDRRRAEHRAAAAPAGGGGNG